ncbi:MAG: BrnA antitoxin family protein [Lacipirellulaceae bacterium]
MRNEYDFAEATKNPYAEAKRQVTIRLDGTTIDYFQTLSAETGIRYQTLINLFLRECAAKNKRPSLTWK